jgi:hypothetical protein
MQSVAKVRKSYQAATSKTVSNCKEHIRYSPTPCRYDIRLLTLTKLLRNPKWLNDKEKHFKITIQKRNL